MLVLDTNAVVFEPDRYYSYRSIAEKMDSDVKSLEYMVKHSPEELLAVKLGPRKTRFKGSDLNRFINNPKNHEYKPRKK